MKKDNSFTLLIAGIVSIGGILYGYDVGVISGALLFIKMTIPMTETQTGIIVGAVLGGALIGTLISGPIADGYGRRTLIIAASIIFIFGVVCILIAHSFWMILLARLLLGIGVGVVSVGVPLYVAEIVPAEDRGKYMTFFQLLLTFGIVAAYLVDLAFTPTGNWRAMFAVVLIPSLLLFVGMLFLPETPRWLMAKGRVNAAEKILQRILSNEHHVKKDLYFIRESLNTVEGHWRELFSYCGLATLTAVAIAICNQLTGVNAFLQYAPLILQETGMDSNMIAMTGSVGIGLLNFAATLFSLMFIDSIGRRPLLLTGIFGLCLAEMFMSLIFYFNADAHQTAFLSLVGMLVFIVFYAIGPGVVVWLAVSELFPTRLRGKGMALCLFFNSLTSTLISTFFLPATHRLGLSETYFIAALFSITYFLIAYFLMPETKAKTLEQIQIQWSKE